MVDSSSHRLSTVCVLAAVSVAITTGDVSAQIQVTTWTPIQEGPAITAVLGRAVTSSVKRASFDLSTRIDTPVGEDHLVRLEAGKASWPFQRMVNPPGCCPGRPDSNHGVLATDRIAITRVTASLIRRHIVGEGDLPGDWTPFYAGGGIGAYYFRSIDRQPYARPWRFGIHGIAGMEIPLPNTRIAISGEVQAHIPGVPGTSLIQRDWFSILSGSLGLKIRM